MGWVKKKVPATTNNITTGIINFLLSKGHSASRINVQGQWDEKAGLWRPSKSRKGFLDISACISGRAVAIDVKHGRDKLGEDQLKFIAEWEAAGGLTFAAGSVNDFVEWYYSTTFTAA